MTSLAPIDESPFAPPWWLRSGHAQTLYRKFAPLAQVNHRRQRLELADGDFIDLDWSADIDPAEAASDQIVLLLHGLCGCSRSSYVLALQALLNQLGIPSVAMNFRGCSGTVNRLARTYHSGATSDLEEVFGFLQSQFTEHRFAMVGYSLGANVLLKWLGEQDRPGKLVAAAAVSTPFQLAACSQAMLSGLSRMYGSYFVRQLGADLQRKQQFLRQSGSSAELQRLKALDLETPFRNIWDFDDRVTAPLNGFADANDYYKRCSSASFLPAIKARTLLLQSADDPLIPATVIPDPAALPANITMRTLNAGGHVGFISNGQPGWLEARVAQFITGTTADLAEGR